jgi:uncharacterized protein (DUF1800 family)
MLLEVAQDRHAGRLDQAQSRKEHPNENFAREVMELFALGEGHYTEDISGRARADRLVHDRLARRNSSIGRSA